MAEPELRLLAGRLPEIGLRAGLSVATAEAGPGRPVRRPLPGVAGSSGYARGGAVAGAGGGEK